MIPVTVNLPAHTRGDTWNAPAPDDPGGLTIGPIQINGLAPTESLKRCRLYFRKRIGGALGYGFTSEEVAGFGQIVITDAATWLVFIPPQALPLEVGFWRWDFETTDNADVVRTLYSGELEVAKDQSHDDD